MFNAKKGRVELNGNSMGYACFGKGSRNLVILPGLSTTSITGTPGAAEGLAAMYHIFAKEYTVYFFDRLDKVPPDYSVAAMADDTAAAMKLLGIEKTCLFGVSQGGMIAQALAENYPEMVEKLVLGATLPRQNPVIREVVGKWTELCEKGDYTALNRSSFELLYTENYLKKNRIALSAALKIKPEDPQKFIILAKACLTFDGYDALEKIQCPTLVIGARNDKVVTPEASEEIAQKLGCELYIYENYGHAVYDEAEDFKQRLYDFLKGSVTPNG